ncbi:MAG: hypothetical protein IT513_05265 [Burkholderiales bacterium]|nr:hypothetical protein [Burkholderiales bacterium]
MKSAKFDMPLLSRSTEWSAERLAKLSLVELKALQANAERLGEPELAARCATQATTLRRATLKAQKPTGSKPKPVVKKVLEES